MNGLVLLAVLAGRAVWWLLVGVGAAVWWALVAVCALARRVLVSVGQLVVFVVEPVDQWVTAALGMGAVLPQVRRPEQVVRAAQTRWQDRRAGVVEAELMDGVWR